MSLWTTIANFLTNVPPWAIVEADQAGIFLRGGKIHKDVGPGFYLKWPMYDKVRKVEVVEQLIRTDIVSVNTKDGISYVGKGAILYKVEDAGLSILSIQDFDDALPCVAAGALAMYISKQKSTELSYSKARKAMLRAVIKRADEWGLKIIRVLLPTFCPHKTYRLMANGAPKTLMLEGE